MTEKSSAARRIEPGASQTTGKGRIVGVVVRVDGRDRGFLFLRDRNDQEYFAHRSAFADVKDFRTLEVGEAVSFRETITTKGTRAFDVRRATSAAELAFVEEMEKSRGNR